VDPSTGTPPQNLDRPATSYSQLRNADSKEVETFMKEHLALPTRCTVFLGNGSVDVTRSSRSGALVDSLQLVGRPLVEECRCLVSGRLFGTRVRSSIRILNFRTANPTAAAARLPETH
jgi:hypothetical protein